MPPRYSYWTILSGGLPTAFRAAQREELLPTFQQLRSKHPDTELKWFQRGKLWDSPESARSSQADDRGRRDARETRGKDWRPGGLHRDPKQPYRDAKKARNTDRRRQRFERREGASRNRVSKDGAEKPAASSAPKRPTVAATRKPVSGRRTGRPQFKRR